jgi:hypothetical protein
LSACPLETIIKRWNAVVAFGKPTSHASTA